MESLDEVITWGQKRWKIEGDARKVAGLLARLDYLVAIANHQATYSRTVNHGPDDTSPFGKPVYLKDMNVTELKEYLLSGLSKPEQVRIFAS